MFQRISYTWTLMGASANVLKRQKSLLLFPLLSGICCILVLASFLVPVITGHAPIVLPKKSDAPEQQALFYGYWFLFYFCNYFVIVFFNTAVVACAALSFEGKQPTLGDGLKASLARLPQIVGWSLLSATVGIVLRIIEDRSEKIGQFVAGLLGMAWSLVTYLAVPVLVLEKKGPISALTTSAGLLKKTWGEQLAGSFSFGMIFGLLSIPGIIAIVASFALAGSATTLMIAGITFGVLYLIVLSLVQSVLEIVFQTALYLYCRDGRAPEGFSTEILGSALATK